MSGTISRDEWLAALGETAECDPNALTVWELCEQFKADRLAIQRRVRALVADGKARRTFKVYNGRRQPAYVLVQHEARPPARKR
jgi:hypothetical protein